MSNAAYDKVVNRMKQIAAGTMGWISLTAASKECGVPKDQLKVIAEVLGLSVQSSHGKHGMTASKPQEVR